MCVCLLCFSSSSGSPLCTLSLHLFSFLCYSQLPFIAEFKPNSCVSVCMCYDYDHVKFYFHLSVMELLHFVLYSYNFQGFLLSKKCQGFCFGRSILNKVTGKERAKYSPGLN